MRTLSLCAIMSFILLFHTAAFSEEKTCLTCHGKLTKEKVVHQAVEMGCPTCHDGIDAGTVPHKKTKQTTKGLSAEQPELCYGCHDKTLFAKKTVHAAVGMGCTGCHNPHSSKNAKLLVSEVPGLCFTCHDKKEFNKKNVHAPVAGGMCLSCHSPHASDEMALLKKRPLDVCTECHAEVMKKPHAVAGFSAGRHPLGEPRIRTDKKTGVVAEIWPKDLARQDKPFYCGSCHNPHSSDSRSLFRFPAKASMELCKNCHKM